MQDQGHAIGIVERGNALQHQPVRSHVIAVIRGEDDQRVVQLIQLFQRCQQAADLLIHQRAEGVITGRRFCELRPVQCLPDPLNPPVDGGPAGQVIVEAGGAGDLGRVVALVKAAGRHIGVVGRFRAEEQGPGLIGPAGRLAQEVDAIAVDRILRRGLDRLIQHTVEQVIPVAGLLHLAAGLHGIVPRDQPQHLLVLLDLVRVEAEILQPVAALHVPLAEIAGVITGRLQVACPEIQPLFQFGPVRLDSVDHIDHTVAVRQQAGEQAGPGRRADWIRRIAAAELGSAGRQPVQIGRLAGRLSFDRVGSLLVGDEKEQIGSRVFFYHG